MKADETKSNTLKFGTNATTFKDVGVDLCAKKGGWGWSNSIEMKQNFVTWRLYSKSYGWI